MTKLNSQIGYKDYDKITITSDWRENKYLINGHNCQFK